ncbi:hypothetical protein BH09PSE6_BH09PSE6_11600 [soil metagenome]
MTPDESLAILKLCLLAAFVDGDKHDRERAEIKRIAERFGEADATALPSLYQDVLMKRVSMSEVAAALATADARHLAFEMAVCVCDADGAQSKAEQAFLGELRQVLRVDPATADDFAAKADALAAAPLPASTTGAPAVETVPDEAALDRSILNAAVLNGALELLPESLSTLAIIPLQMKLVYGIGKQYGYELDSGHVKDLLATMGVGLTSQYLEQAGRKLIGGLLGKLGGGLLRGAGNQAVSSGASFVSTYALGHVAKRYYGGGRPLSAQLLKDAYADVASQASELQTRYLPAMRDRAATLDTNQIMSMVRGA